MSFLFVGGERRVYALQKVSGRIEWQVELKKSRWFSSGSSFVSLVEGKDQLFAFTSGRALCLSKESSRVLWESEIKKLNSSIATLAVDATLLGAVALSLSSSAAVAADSGDGDGDDGGGGE
jgi:hypothetical protein